MRLIGSSGVKLALFSTLVSSVLAAPVDKCEPTKPSYPVPGPPGSGSCADWLKSVDQRIRAIEHEIGEASWAYETNITDYNEARATEADMKFNTLATTILAEVLAVEPSCQTADEKRQVNLLKLDGGVPKDPAAQAELSQILSRMNGLYSTGKVGGKPLDPDLTEVMLSSRNYDELLNAYIGWRNATGPAIKPLYERFVELSNQGARDYGYADTGALWRAGYDMPAKEFTAMMEKTLDQVFPLYEQLHCYTRSKLAAVYGEDKVNLKDGFIPAHLLGNMWSQEWGGILDLLLPYPDVPAMDTTEALKEQNYDAVRMHKLSEEFYTSLGLDPLPESFWTKSMLTRPDDGREVVCHASAWDFGDDDLRIKMCTVVNHGDLMTVHHEQGHLYYDHYYRHHPYVYRSGAADHFHEAIGDAIQLSVVTPAHLKKVGLLGPDVKESREQTINAQMSVALDKIVSLPWTYLVDQWRWKVFSGEVKPDQYQAEWLKLIEKFQGVKRPAPSAVNDFDPGAKFHVPNNTPYIRYFGATAAAFQFHQALCKAAGVTGPLHECDIYQNKAAGEQYAKMLSMGRSQPWQEAMKVVTNGQFDTLDGSAIIEYFQPLLEFLKEQNQGKQCGWKRD
ncbi:zinc-dependent metallopeptidase [Gaertneriomyces semiglobifer]|nr:zinc-dependent metallopeptidase [Gaertneriomyces semiglobifer]